MSQILTLNVGLQREFSTGINEGEDYKKLPRTIVISILGFVQFPQNNNFHNEFQALEVTTHEPLTDKMVLHYYELPKLSPLNTADNGKDLWLKLFRGCGHNFDTANFEPDFSLGEATSDEVCP